MHIQLLHVVKKTLGKSFLSKSTLLRLACDFLLFPLQQMFTYEMHEWEPPYILNTKKCCCCCCCCQSVSSAFLIAFVVYAWRYLFVVRASAECECILSALDGRTKAQAGNQCWGPRRPRWLTYSYLLCGMLITCWKSVGKAKPEAVWADSRKNTNSLHTRTYILKTAMKILEPWMHYASAGIRHNRYLAVCACVWGIRGIHDLSKYKI